MSDSITEPIGDYKVTTTKAQIASEATQAALAGVSINDSRPYPFGSQRAAHFKSVYRLCRPLADEVATTAPKKGARA